MSRRLAFFKAENVTAVLGLHVLGVCEGVPGVTRSGLGRVSIGFNEQRRKLALPLRRDNLLYIGVESSTFLASNLNLEVAETLYPSLRRAS